MIISPHSKVGVVPKTSQPGGIDTAAAIAITPSSASRSPNQAWRATGMLRTSATKLRTSGRGASGISYWSRWSSAGFVVTRTVRTPP